LHSAAARANTLVCRYNAEPRLHPRPAPLSRTQRQACLGRQRQRRLFDVRAARARTRAFSAGGAPPGRASPHRQCPAAGRL